MKYIFFDMDGTLSESRQEASPEMVEQLNRIKKIYKVIIASGAELKRMQWQVPVTDITFFAQNGNHVTDEDKLIWIKELDNKKEIIDHIYKIAHSFGYDIKEENIEDRGSEIVVSFTGFHAPFDIKTKFDPDRKIRLEMLKRHPHPNGYVAGTSGIDFIPFTKGENIKEYITLNNINPSECLYIGDALEPGANDYSVVGIIPTFSVKNPEETLAFLKQL